MAAGHDGRQAVVAPGPAHEAVADFVDGDAHASLARPARDQVAALFVQVGQGQAADAALGRGADLRQLHQRGPEALAVDAQAADVGGGSGAHVRVSKNGRRGEVGVKVGVGLTRHCGRQLGPGALLHGAKIRAKGRALDVAAFAAHSTELA